MGKRSESESGSKPEPEESHGAPAELPQEVIPFDPVPTYEESRSGPSDSASLSVSHSLSATVSASTPQPPAGTSALAPTVTSPFNFPTDGKGKDGSVTAPPPVYKVGSSSSSSSAARTIAFPQIKPDPDSPFLVAYAPVLLSYGITEETWRSFLTTISAFLTATISDRALSHATDVAAHIGQNPKNLGRNVAAHAKSISRNVSDNAKRGNIIGAAMGLIGGTISLPISTALGVVGTTLSLPGQAIDAVTKRPRTPQERAATYAAVANEEWLHMRGLHAHLFDSAGLAHHLGMPLDTLLSLAWETKESDAGRQMRALEPHIAGLDVDEGAMLQLKTQTLWLVLMPGKQPSSS
ncbi:hypothetical protein N5P37_008959 [Trichoderma harzianum]|uniref:Uncharacterized protein n=1 Tax=Trichoderma harzianum CBS 226.95 TaxID=983964 RepID=A0A2T4A6R3_TRIHA|nr:hypothetical protein M431DRAFT_509948 [Trichoderma harzianum CBS 226.95]KAK0758560.1 hypothetical protein N5P37_008959 [Trichoderma harzianum]PKK42312.1 hypothetical protein CI102_13153 [Trichoderma harzianum]PTB52673.1 hypothetical protein M431DRAFT_509948 [Trichoderma harzianum CBS 226.95]